ncbi:hypothetical protein V6N11_083258 [Hibiscus sabdariffa]|uniref:BURP domain-containing protein n=1 Tax=Hibiscus sabdariffa TaxID=183260 RepID=A0ABR2QLM9_9ROSI
MGNEIVSCSFFLVLLITLAPGNVAGGDGNVLRLPSMDGKEDAGESAPSDSGMGMGMGMGVGVEVEGKDPDFKVFFFMKDVQVGKTIPASFPDLKESDPARNLPRKTRTSLPPPLLLHPPCFPTSLGHGENTHHLRDRTTGRAQGLYYIRRLPRRFHTTNRMFKVTLRGENGAVVEAVLVCHMDTSKWNRNFYAFRQLGVERGTTEDCHFIPAYDMAVVLVPN